MIGTLLARFIVAVPKRRLPVVSKLYAYGDSDGEFVQYLACGGFTHVASKHAAYEDGQAYSLPICNLDKDMKLEWVRYKNDDISCVECQRVMTTLSGAF